ncbi:MAG: DUF4244 domain-containing protein [Bifidobacteriaceae bacterium]|jgi:3,4-dihydroxy-2-butanone 4-phosphate synthase|nr:DUF4244 domain-containing protein [Bifidobacteriaceae bacterium]
MTDHPSTTPTTAPAAETASSKRAASRPGFLTRLRARARATAERGSATVEYAIALLAAAGFAGLLVTLLTSSTARGWLQSLVERALSL